MQLNDAQKAEQISLMEEAAKLLQRSWRGRLQRMRWVGAVAEQKRRYQAVFDPAQNLFVKAPEHNKSIGGATPAELAAMSCCSKM